MKSDSEALDKVLKTLRTKVAVGSPDPNEVIAFLLARASREGLPDRETTIDNDRRMAEDDIINFLDTKYGLSSENAKNFPSDRIIREENLPAHDDILSGDIVKIDNELKSTYWEPFFEFKSGNALFESDKRARILGVKP
jgi:hypothetical protein